MTETVLAPYFDVTLSLLVWHQAKLLYYLQSDKQVIFSAVLSQWLQLRFCPSCYLCVLSKPFSCPLALRYEHVLYAL